MYVFISEKKVNRGRRNPSQLCGTRGVKASRLPSSSTDEDKPKTGAGTGERPLLWAPLAQLSLGLNWGWGDGAAAQRHD